MSLDVGELPLPSIRTLPGAAILLSLVLYPYIYLLSRNSFAGRSGAQFDAARVLGHGPYSAFFRIALPASRPAILGGLALVLMETLADFGVVSYFSVPTFSTGIFRTWLGLGDATAALRLAAFMLLFVIMLIVLEERSRRGTADSSDLTQASRINLTGVKAGLAIAACLVPVMLGFAIPDHAAPIRLRKPATKHQCQFLSHDSQQRLSRTDSERRDYVDCLAARLHETNVSKPT